MKNHKLVKEYKTIRASNFTDIALYHCTRIRWMLEKIENGEIIKGTELHHYIINLPGRH